MKYSSFELAYSIYGMAENSSLEIGVINLSRQILKRYVRMSGISSPILTELLTDYIKIAGAVKYILNDQNHLEKAIARQNRLVERGNRDFANLMIIKYGDRIDSSNLNTIGGFRSQLSNMGDPDNYLSEFELLWRHIEAKEAEFLKALMEIESLKARFIVELERMVEELPDKVTWHPKTWKFLIKSLAGFPSREDLVTAVSQLETYMSGKKARNALLLDISRNQNR